MSRMASSREGHGSASRTRTVVAADDLELCGALVVRPCWRNAGNDSSVTCSCFDLNALLRWIRGDCDALYLTAIFAYARYTDESWHFCTSFDSCGHCVCIF